MNFMKIYCTVPVHQGIDQVITAGSSLHHGMLGRAPSSGSKGLGSGSFIRLFDPSLALHYLGFEQPLLVHTFYFLYSFTFGFIVMQNVMEGFRIWTLA